MHASLTDTRRGDPSFRRPGFGPSELTVGEGAFDAATYGEREPRKIYVVIPETS